MSRLDRLGVCSSPIYGQSMVWLLVLLGLYNILHMNFYPQVNHVQWVSMLGWLPPDVLLDPLWKWGLRLGYAVAAAMWLSGRALPFSSWLTAAIYIVALSSYEETLDYVNHKFHTTACLLIIYAMWYHFYWRDIVDARKRGQFWSSPLYPRWVSRLALLYLGSFYTLSGLCKLMLVGPGWANGTSLQLWVSLAGKVHSPVRQLILANRTVAHVFQFVTLWTETLAVLVMVAPLRIVLGTLLLGFHVFQETVFGFRFYANTALILAVLLPVESLVERLRARVFSGAK